MPPQKTLEERVRELEENRQSVNAKIWAVVGYVLIGFFIVIYATHQNLVRMSQAIGKMEQSTVPSQKVP